MVNKLRVVLAVVGIAVAGMPLTSCTLFSSDSRDVSSLQDNFKEPAESLRLIPDGSAEDNLPYFQEVLRQFSSGKNEVSGKAVVDAVADAGFDKSQMQVSFDKTPLGLDADNIFVSVRFEDFCLIGQVVTKDRSFVTEAVPTVGPDKDLCLIGKTRTISW